MKYKMLYAIPSIGFLAACGGSSDGSAINPTSPPPASTTTLKTYSDGSGVTTGRITVDGSTSNYVLASTDPVKATQVVSGAVNLNVVDSAEDGRFYYVERTGTSSNGSTVSLLTVGESLNLTGSEFAALSFVVIDNSLGIASSGSPVSSLPAGSYTYTGTASVLGADGDGDGTFTMTANFTNRTASIAAAIPSNSPAGANNPAYFFGSNNLAINNTNGSFSTSNANIGLTGTGGNSASIYGYFAGSNAQGVSGIVYENGDTSQYIGGFYGSR